MQKEELQQFLQEGEGQFIEFKQSVDSKLSKEVVAFANASGGKIVVGITDERKIKGVCITNELKSRVYDIANNCDPSIQLSLETFENILIITVPEGNNKPYQCSDGFYIRIGPNSQKLTREKILDLCIKNGKIRFDEQVCEAFNFNDFDDSKFRDYLALTKITSTLEKEIILKNLFILTKRGMTNAGVLFFAKDPYKYIRTSKIRCVHFNDEQRINILDKKEVDLGIIGNIEFAVNYLKERTPVKYEIKGIKRVEFPLFPEEAYREAIVNAIIHRDYQENGEVAVEKLKNGISINNPGGLIPSLSVEEFGKSSRPRNRLLADLLSRTIFMEKVGTGIQRIKNYCMNNKNEVDFNFNDNNFTIEIKLTRENTKEKTRENTREKIIQIIGRNSQITTEEIAKETLITVKGVEWHIRQLKNKGILQRIGPDKGGSWVLVKLK
jgi:ATP-dependent DNA helicase RecG